MMVLDASSSPKRFQSRSYVWIFEDINAVLSAFCAAKPLSTAVGQRSTTVGLPTFVLLGLFIEYSNIRSFWGYSIRWDLEYSF